MRLDFHPDFKGLRFKPEDYRRMMRRVLRVLSWVLAAIGLGLLALWLFRG